MKKGSFIDEVGGDKAVNRMWLLRAGQIKYIVEFFFIFSGSTYCNKDEGFDSSIKPPHRWDKHWETYTTDPCARQFHVFVNLLVVWAMKPSFPEGVLFVRSFNRWFNARSCLDCKFNWSQQEFLPNKGTQSTIRLIYTSFRRQNPDQKNILYRRLPIISTCSR